MEPHFSWDYLHNYYSFSESIWSHNDSVIFNLDLNDTTSFFNVSFQLRANTSYKWSNIYIFSDIFFPNGKARRDTFEFYLADEKGHWVGDRSGLIVEYSFPIYKNHTFLIAENIMIVDENWYTTFDAEYLTHAILDSLEI